MGFDVVLVCGGGCRAVVVLFRFVVKVEGVLGVSGDQRERCREG